MAEAAKSEPTTEPVVLPKLEVINDYIKVFLPPIDEYGFGGNDGEEKGAESGIVVDMPDKLYFFGMHSFAYEASFMATEKLAELLAYYRKKLLGKKIWWSSMKERGQIIVEADGKRYAYLHFTDVMAASEADAEGLNTYGEAGGSFRIPGL